MGAALSGSFSSGLGPNDLSARMGVGWLAQGSVVLRGSGWGSGRFCPSCTCRLGGQAMVRAPARASSALECPGQMWHGCGALISAECPAGAICDLTVGADQKELRVSGQGQREGPLEGERGPVGRVSSRPAWGSGLRPSVLPTGGILGQVGVLGRGSPPRRLRACLGAAGEAQRPCSLPPPVPQGCLEPTAFPRGSCPCQVP